jgi:hypothetical protein
MSPSREELAELFNGLTDDELERRAAGRTLTESAQEVAEQELRRRGMTPPAPPEPLPAPRPASEGGQRFVLVSSYRDPLEAETVRARLEAEGIPVLLGAAQHSLAIAVVAPLLGGVRVEVPEDCAAQARRLLADLDAGRLALEPDAETADATRIATARRSWRTWVFDAIILIVATLGLVLPLVRIVILRDRYQEWNDVPLWPFVLPAGYLIAALLFAVRSKWSLPLFAAHLVASVALQFTLPVVAYVIGPITVGPLFTGMILYYAIRLLGEGKLR